MIKSIRTRLTLWYAFILSIILILFCFALYFSFYYTLNQQVNQALLRQTHSISDAYLPESNVFQDLPAQDFLTSPVLWFRVVQQDGSLFQPAPSFTIFSQPFPLGKAQELPSETPLFETFTLSDNQSFRSIIFPIEIGLNRFGWIQLVKPISNIVETLNLIKTYMFLLVPVSILLLSIGGQFLARKTLSPIEQIRKQVAEIYDKNLAQRIKINNPNDELGLLTQTFNQMLERLQLAFDSQRRFLADASHELKTPITILRSQWEKISEIKSMPIEIKKQIQTDIEELVRLAKLVDDLSLLSAMDDNQVKIEQKPVDLTEVLQEVYEDGIFLTENKNQLLNYNKQGPFLIKGDKNRLTQLFLNLIDNSVKYTQEAGKITLSLNQKEDKIFIEVQDNGIGISSKDLPYVSNRFYRVDKSRSRQFGGSGLGLSICQWIVKAHFGEIEIKSELGKGTKVRITFDAL